MIVMVSGGFDPPHIGHLRMIESASTFGDVIVALNSNKWLKRKKGKPFMDWYERAELLREWRHVGEVIPVGDDDGTVCQALRSVRPNYFANGGDRTHENKQEGDVCRELGIIQLFGIGGNKIQSSSKLCAIR